MDWTGRFNRRPAQDRINPKTAMITKPAYLIRTVHNQQSNHRHTKTGSRSAEPLQNLNYQYHWEMHFSRPFVTLPLLLDSSTNLLTAKDRFIEPKEWPKVPFFRCGILEKLPDIQNFEESQLLLLHTCILTLLLLMYFLCNNFVYLYIINIFVM